jgi:hypothetical protein
VLLDMIVSFWPSLMFVRNQWFWLGVPILNLQRHAFYRFNIHYRGSGRTWIWKGLRTGSLRQSTTWHSHATSIYKTKLMDCFDAYDTVLWRMVLMSVWSLPLWLCAMKLFFSNVFLFMLPRQRRKLKVESPRWINAPLTLCLSICPLCIIVTTNLMSVFESTACYKIAGEKRMLKRTLQYILI